MQLIRHDTGDGSWNFGFYCDKKSDFKGFMIPLKKKINKRRSRKALNLNSLDSNLRTRAILFVMVQLKRLIYFVLI